MAGLSIAHGLFTWQDGRVALEASLRSTAPFVDHVLIADGLIDGVPDLGLPHLSELSWLNEAEYLPAQVPINGKEWRGLSNACTWLLDQARAVKADWLLFVDADQELHNGHLLPEWLRQWKGDAYPVARQDGPSGQLLAPWQCVRVAAWRHYVAGCYVLEHVDGRTVSLVPEGPPSMITFTNAPWVSHHPERRPPWRVRHRLGELETLLEPPPPDRVVAFKPGALIQLPAMSAPQDSAADAIIPSGAPAFYCPGCGTRYFGPGVCVNQHAAIELERDPALTPSVSAGLALPAVGPGAADPSPIPAPAAEPTPPGPETAPSVSGESEPAPDPSPSGPDAASAADSDSSEAASAVPPAEPGTATPTIADPAADPLQAAIMALDHARGKIGAAFESIENAIRVAIENPPGT